MKRFPKRNLTISFLLFFLVFSPISLLAQTPSDPWCNPYGLYPDGTPCPIDGNLYILLAVGVLYGIKKIRWQKKIEEEAKG